CDFLGTQVLLRGHRIVGAALDRGVVRHDHGLAALDQADAGNDARGRGIIVHAVRGKRREFEERGVGVDQRFYTLTRQQLTALFVTFAQLFWPTQPDLCQLFFELTDQGAHVGGIGLKLWRVGANFTLDAIHVSSWGLGVGGWLFSYQPPTPNTQPLFIRLSIAFAVGDLLKLFSHL